MKTFLKTPFRVTVVGSALIMLSSAAVRADVRVTSSPVGVMSTTLAKGQRGLAFPLIAESTLVAVAAGNTAATISLSDTTADPRAALVGGRAYYAEVVNGPLEGERFDVDVAGTLAGSAGQLALKLGAGSNSTLGNIGSDTLAGARLVVRPHVTLGLLQAMISPSLVGKDNGSGDVVLVFEGSDFVKYSLAGDGQRWTRPGNSAVDYRNLVIPPDTSVVIQLASGSKTWTHVGVVRTNAFRKNLVAGQQAFASGFPQDLSFVDVGGFVDLTAPAATRWTGGATNDVADWFERRGAGGTMPANRYFLREDGRMWQRVNNATDVSSSTLLDSTGMFVLRRFNADSGYIIPVPFPL